MERKPRIISVDRTLDPGIDYERASADLRRYLPLKVFTLAWFAAAFYVGAYALAALWLKWWPYTTLDIDSNGAVQLAVSCTGGAMLGATAFSFLAFYWAVGPQSGSSPRYQYDPNWTFWHVARPFAGAVLGIAVYGVLRFVIGAMGAVTYDSTAAASYFTIGFLAGFASTQLFGWLETMLVRAFGVGGR